MLLVVLVAFTLLLPRDETLSSAEREGMPHMRTTLAGSGSSREDVTASTGGMLWQRVAPYLRDLPERSRTGVLPVAEIAADLVESALRGLGGPETWNTATVTRVRSAVRCWALNRQPLDAVLAIVGHLTEHAVDLAVAGAGAVNVATALQDVTDAGNELVRELLAGCHQAAHDQEAVPERAERLAMALLSGRPVEPGAADELAPAYAVMACHIRGEGPARMKTALSRWTARGQLSVLRADGGYVLVPAASEVEAAAAAQRLHRQLPEPAWIGLAWRGQAELGRAREEVVDVLALATAVHAPGVYDLNDVLVDYAVLRQPATSAALARLVAPVVGNSVLYETLQAFIDADGNRSRAAARLVIHRSTLDYRLQRIEQVTGCRPTSARALGMLSAGLTAHAVGNGVALSLPALSA